MDACWVVFDEESNTSAVGFNEEFLDTLQECWHILLAPNHCVAGRPLFTVECNDSLISILSPVTGNPYEFSNTALNFPDRLTKDDVVLRIHHNDMVKTPTQQDILELLTTNFINSRVNSGITTLINLETTPIEQDIIIHDDLPIPAPHL